MPSVRKNGRPALQPVDVYVPIPPTGWLKRLRDQPKYHAFEGHMDRHAFEGRRTSARRGVREDESACDARNLHRRTCGPFANAVLDTSWIDANAETLDYRIPDGNVLDNSCHYRRYQYADADDGTLDYHFPVVVADTSTTDFRFGERLDHAIAEQRRHQSEAEETTASLEWAMGELQYESMPEDTRPRTFSLERPIVSTAVPQHIDTPEDMPKDEDMSADELMTTLSTRSTSISEQSMEERMDALENHVERILFPPAWIAMDNCENDFETIPANNTQVQAHLHNLGFCVPMMGACDALLDFSSPKHESHDDPSSFLPGQREHLPPSPIPSDSTTLPSPCCLSQRWLTRREIPPHSQLPYDDFNEFLDVVPQQRDQPSEGSSEGSSEGQPSLPSEGSYTQATRELVAVLENGLAAHYG
jgi:hypothetical protein